MNIIKKQKVEVTESASKEAAAKIAFLCGQAGSARWNQIIKINFPCITRWVGAHLPALQ